MLRSRGGVLVTVPSNRCRSPHQQALVALASNGHLDPAFGAGGLSSVAFGAVTGLALDPRGRALALGEAMSEEQYGEGEGPFTKLARFGASGASERAFGKHGSVIVPFDGDPEALGVDARGRPLLAGWTLTDSSRPVRGFSIERMTRAGRVDRAFGHHGIATVGFGRGTNAEADAVLVDRRGRIVLSGLVSGARGRQSGTSFGLVRYLPSPRHRKEIHGKAH